MKKYVFASALASAACFAHAEGPEFAFSGFGTVGGVVTNTNEAQYRANLRQNSGADKSPDFWTDSRLGLQENVKFNDTFSAVGQVLTLRRDGATRPVLEWLYAEAKPVDGLSLRAGRMVLPTFLISDSRAVGYSADWIRVPRDVYDWYPATSFDGGQALYQFSEFGLNFQIQASLGKSKSKMYFEGPVIDLTLSNLSSIGLNVDRGNWTFHAAQTRSNFKIALEGLDFSSTVRDVFSEVGLQYDNGHLVALSEFVARRDDHGGPNNSNSYYVHAGYHIDSVTPYVTYSRFIPMGENFDTSHNTYTKSAGVRWDAYKNVAIKAQFDKVFSSIATVRQSDAFAAKTVPINVYSVAADFIF